MFGRTSNWEEFIGEQVKLLRIRKNLTQEELAARAQISVSALKSLEGGKGSTLKSLVSTLEVLGETSWLESLAPEVEISPIQAVELGKQRQRVRRKEG